MDYAFRRTEGALAVVKAGSEDDVIGIISERDYLTKVALLGKQSRTTPVSAICTQGESNLITVSYDETVDECMRKVRLCVVWYGPGRTVGCTLTPPPVAQHQRAQVLASDVRHLLVKDNAGKIVSLFSVKDLCKCVVAKVSPSAHADAPFLPRVFLTPTPMSPVATCFLTLAQRGRGTPDQLRCRQGRLFRVRMIRHPCVSNNIVNTSCLCARVVNVVVVSLVPPVLC
jgi:hypothetical protein